MLESNFIDDGEFDTSLTDDWRYGADSRATILWAHREDRARSVEQEALAVGSWLSPETVIRETAALVTHARIMAERSGATQIAFC